MPEIPEIAKSRLKKLPPQTHPDVDLLAAFAEQRLDPAERTRVLQHLGDCSTCREVVHLSLPEPEGVQAGGTASVKALGWMPWLRWGALAATVAIAASITLYMQRQAFRDQPATYISAKNVASPSATKEQAQPAAPAAGSALQAVPPGKKSRMDDKAPTPQPTAGIAYGRKEKPRVASRQISEGSVADRFTSTAPVAAADSSATNHVESKNHANTAGTASGMIAPPPPPPPRVGTPLLSNEKVEANLPTETVEASNNLQKADAPRVRRSESQPAPAPQTATVVDKLAPSSAQASEESRNREASADQVVTAYNGRPMQNSVLSTLSSPAPAWRLTEGKLQIAQDGAWKDVQFPLGIGVRDVVEQPGGELWVVTSEGKLYRSTDRSAPWQIVEGGWNRKVRGLVFLDAKLGQVFLDNQVWVTSDGGKSWSKR